MDRRSFHVVNQLILDETQRLKDELLRTSQLKEDLRESIGSLETQIRELQEQAARHRVQLDVAEGEEAEASEDAIRLFDAKTAMILSLTNREELRNAITGRGKLSAVKLVKDATCMTIMDAKAWVERYAEQQAWDFPNTSAPSFYK